MIRADIKKYFSYSLHIIFLFIYGFTNKIDLVNYLQVIANFSKIDTILISSYPRALHSYPFLPIDYYMYLIF